MKRYLSAVLAFFLLLPTAGCKKGETGSGGGGSAETEAQRTAVLTGVYTGEEIKLPDGYVPSEGANMRIDRESGVFTARVENAEGDGLLLWISPESGVVQEMPVPIPDGHRFVAGAFSGTDYYSLSHRIEVNEGGEFAVGSHSAEVCLRRFDTKSGHMTDEVELAPYFVTSKSNPDDFYVRGFTVTPDGCLWISAMTELIVLTPNKELAAVFPNFRYNAGLVPAGDDAVCVSPKSEELAFYAPSSRMPLRTLVLPDKPEKIVSAAEGGALYFSTSTGVWRYEFEEEEPKAVMLMDFTNSGTTSANLCGAFGDDAFVLIEGWYEDARLVLYRRSDDVDLSAVDTVEIAHALEDEVDASILKSTIVTYNKEHPGVRVILRDYSVYGSDEDPGGGRNRLLMDVVTGVYRPDIVIGSTLDPIRLTGGEVADTLVRKGFCADLMPYLEADAELNPSNLFGAVKRFFSDGEGGMWGIASEFSVRTVFGPRSTVGAYADGWTLDEFLDFADTWQDPAFLMQSFSRETAFPNKFGPDAFASFIDAEAGTCSFDSPVFRRLARFWLSLPKDYLSWFGVTKCHDPSPGWYDLCYNGQVAAQVISLYDASDLHRMEAQFGTKDWVIVGFPSEKENASFVKTEAAYMLLKTSSKPDLAWDVIRTLVLKSDRYGIPALKPRFDKESEAELERYEIHYFSGGVRAGSLRDDDPRAKPPKQPHYISVLEENDLARFKNYLDEEAGFPMIDFVSPEINAIVLEELSALEGGVGTPEDCAKKIQSRASIWLAEHK